MPYAWDQVKELLASALELRPEERTEFVRRASGGDQALLAEVESLLLHHDQADSFLENSPAARWPSFDPGLWAGKTIGAYKIVGPLGEGGMSVVYLAERNDEHFRKRVALKMLRPGFYTAEIVDRFRNERQTLATLDHPNIVKLLDGGNTEEGLPYLVMDYVEGLPIDEYCALHQLSTRLRLQLFLGICAAVHYAHQNLVVHRDLKPGNILMTKDGVPRLLDFGIAKLLNPDFMQTPLVTRTEWRPMTVEYASPEQVRGERVTHACDIYALGTLLYELLAGVRPFNTAHCSRSDVERMICEEAPERPSTRRRALEGDLDTIVMKALRKEPQQRYLSVEEFAADIQRHLDGHPVKARNTTWSYRAGRFVRRHKESFATAIIASTLMAAVGAWEAHRIWSKHSQLVATVPTRVRPTLSVLGFRNLSGRPDEAWISTALSEMLIPQLAAGEELRTIAGDTVEQAKIDLHLADAESIPASSMDRVRALLGTGYTVIGSYLDDPNNDNVRFDARLVDTATGQTVASASEAGPEAELAGLTSSIGTRFRERLGLSKISELESQELAASIPSNHDALRLYSQGLMQLRNFDALAARDLFKRAVASEPSYPLSHFALASVWRTLGHDPDARDQAKQALDSAGRLPRENHLLVEARYYETIRNWPKAIETYEILVSFFPDSTEYRISLADAKTSGGRGKDALNDLSELARSNPEAAGDPRIDLAISQAASAIGDSKLRRDAAERAAYKAERQGAQLLLARARTLECRALANLGENARAGAVCEEARRIFAETGDREELARALHSMAEVPMNQGDFITAGKLYRQSLAIMQEIGDEQGLGSELLNLGLISVKQGDSAAGLKMYEESFRSYQKAGDKTGMAAAMGNAGNLLRAQGKLADALARFRQTLDLSNALGHRSSSALALEAIGLVLTDQGDLAAATQMFHQALATQQDIGEKSNYAETLRSIGQVSMQEDDLIQARKFFDNAFSIQQQLGETGSAAETRLALAELACESGHPNEGEQMARAALRVFQSQNELDAEILAGVLLSRALLDQGKIDEADASLKAPLQLARKSLNVAIRLSLMLAHARVLAAKNQLALAERTARGALAASPKDFLGLRLEASLGLAEIEIKEKQTAQARQRLQEVAIKAKDKGFALIARNASTAQRQ